RYDAREFVFPMSATKQLTEDELMNESDDSLSFARNEIFARHGKQFDDYYLQCYFDSCSWYTGTSADIGAEALNETEAYNVELIKKAEEDYQASHPYPKKVLCGDSVNETLCTELGMQVIDYRVSGDADTGSYDGIITIDGQDFKLSDFGIDPEVPDEEEFFITDINPYLDGLEIAILDFGNNDFNTTYFFGYAADQKLYYIGEVPGCPFKGVASASCNGFADEGAVIGTVRTDLLETASVYVSYWYDYDGKALVEQDAGCRKMVPSEAHELYMDLPVYNSMDENSDTVLLKAQKEVYFMKNDNREWIAVKGKDGVEGYIHVNDGVITNIGEDAANVFSGLGFSG
ncbi:MAG TPA: YARHG domain-containing protein, partial [Lachnospiraceae bacterium]|nr:YARHG domain-containing protein [Lachnospiraceae bacterium]